jgi:hypothetical protein
VSDSSLDPRPLMPARRPPHPQERIELFKQQYAAQYGGEALAPGRDEAREFGNPKLQECLPIVVIRLVRIDSTRLAWAVSPWASVKRDRLRQSEPTPSRCGELAAGPQRLGACVALS